MDLWQLELFLAVVEHASVTRAAEKTDLSVGAVSRQLHNLAAELHTDLFVRSGKHLVPTAAGTRLAEHARATLRQVRNIEQEFENDPDRDTRPFHFATGATTLIHRLGNPLRVLREKYPNVPIQITVSATEEMVSGLLDRRFDLALISLPFPEEGLTILPLFNEELLILGPSAKAVRGWHVGCIQPAELAWQPFLLYPKRSNMRTIIDGFFCDIGIVPKVTMEADDTGAIKRLVESGFGYSLLPEYALQTQPRFFHVFRVPDRRVVRRQALAMAKSEYPRALTQSVALFLQSTIAASENDSARPQHLAGPPRQPAHEESPRKR